MRAWKWIALIAIVAVVALFVPFIPMTNGQGQFLGAHYQSTSTVSPAYYAFRCGSYVNSGVSAQLASGYQAFYQYSKGYTFSCVYTSAG
ncbi:MAG: hypothetical protein HY247_06460 [archaeon]|nr:MAG: hypothetical protein HY247_06460 [archaeon]